GQVVARADGDRAAERVVFLAGEAVGRADVVAGAPGEARGAVGLGGVAGERAALVIEYESRGAEAVGDVVAGVFVGDERARGAVVEAAAQGGEHEGRGGCPSAGRCVAELAGEQQEGRERDDSEHGQGERRRRAAARVRDGGGLGG